MFSVLLKSKLSASFKLQYIDDFVNNLLSFIGRGGMQDALLLVLKDTHPALAQLKEEFDNLSQDE